MYTYTMHACLYVWVHVWIYVCVSVHAYMCMLSYCNGDVNDQQNISALSTNVSIICNGDAYRSLVVKSSACTWTSCHTNPRNYAHKIL